MVHLKKLFLVLLSLLFLYACSLAARWFLSGFTTSTGTSYPEAVTELIIADESLSETLRYIVSPTISLSNTYAIFTDQNDLMTRIYQFPSLKSETYSDFRPSPFIIGEGLLLLTDADNNTLVTYNPISLTTRTTEYPPTEYVQLGAYHFFFDTENFILDGNVFSLRNGIVTYLASAQLYQKKIGGNLKMISSSSKDAPANVDTHFLSCDELFSESLPPIGAEVLLTEKELPCIVSRFSEVYWESKRELLALRNPGSTRAEDYLLLQVDLNRTNTAYLLDIIREKRKYTQLSADIVPSPEETYLSLFPLYSYSFNNAESALHEFPFLLDLPYGIYPRMEVSSDPEVAKQNDNRTLYITEDISIFAERYCSRSNITNCTRWRDIYTFTTPQGVTQLEREDAALVFANAEHAVFVTERGIEKILF